MPAAAYWPADPERTDVDTTYRRDYEELGLDEAADWPTARGTYRRLVNTWHPDRYAQRPREREHARQRFIRLTRSFDRLRGFYRENGRLPLQRIVPRAPESLRVDRVARARHERRRRAAPAVAVETELHGDELLGRAAASRAEDPAGGRRRAHLLWASAGACVLAATVGLFLVIDHSERRAAYESGRDVLLETAPSPFARSASEVRRQATRGSFVTREDGELGDQLMEDMFR